MFFCTIASFFFCFLFLPIYIYIKLPNIENLLFLIELIQIKYFFENCQQFVSGDKLDKFEHQQRVMNVLKVNNNFVICIPINGIFFNSTITAKVGELWLPSGMPLSNILMKNRNVSDQLQSLFSKYMKSDSDLEVNVSKEVNEWIEKRLNMNLKTNSIKNSNLIHAFDSAVIQVFSIIGGSYTRFMRRSDYPKLAHQIAKSSAQLQPKHTIILTNLNLIADPMVPQPLHYNYNHDNHNDQDLSARTLNENANDNNSNIQIDHSVTITTTGAPKINARAISATSSRPHETHSDNVDIIHNQWILHEIIGKGAFGIVHRATNILTQKEVAIKFSYSVKQHSQYIYHAQTAKNELHILKKLTKLSHPNVIRLQYQNYRYTYTTQKGYQFDTVLLVMEYAPHGQLFDILRYSGPFDQSIARIYFQQIISALKFFHNNGIVHRDLKTENMLLDAFFDIKICDFGLSVILENKNDLIEQVGKVGTKGYIAPEILRHETYDASCDIFSAGVILFILLTSRYPFAEATKDDQIYKILTEEDHIHNVSYSGGSGDSGIVCEKFWETVNHNRSNRIDDAAVQHLIESMIRYDPKQRSSIENIQQNEWYCRGDEKDEAVQLYEIMNKKYNETQLKKIQRMKKNSRSRSRNSNKIPQNEETHVHDTADNMDMNIDSDDRDHNDQVMDQKKTLAEFESQLSQYGHGPFRVKKANYNHNLRNVSLGPGRITTTYGATLTPINEVKQMDTDDDDEEIENSLIPKRSASKMSSLLYSIQERLSADHDGESKLSSIIKSVDHNRISPHLSSQVTSTIVPLEPLKCYRINDPLVIMVGIGDYDDTLQNLIGITKDYKNIFYTFNNQYNYSLFYQTKDNQQIYTKHRFIDLKNEHLSEKIKIKWVEDEIIDFFKKARDIIIENKHDSLIAVISSHGDTDGVIYDSNFDEVQLIEIFSIFMKNDCPHLQDKPKIFFVDACRGTMKSLNKEHVLNNDLKTEASTKKLKGPNNQHKDRDRDSPNGTQSQAGLQQSQKEKTRITPLMYGDSSKTEERRTNSHILIENQQTNSKHSTYNYNGDNNNEIAMVDLEKENKQTEPKSFLSKLEEKWLPYHNEANFQIVYANIDGYAVVEAGKKGGYLIQAIKRVFCNKEYILNKQMYLNDIVLHINQEAQKMIGKVLINQQVQQVSQMDRNVKFLKRTNVV